MKRGRFGLVCLALFALIAIISFVWGAVISPTTGELYQYQQHTITINNLNADANITQVNLTFYLNYSANTFSTSSTDAIITNPSSRLWLFTNYSGLISGTAYGGTSADFLFTLSGNQTGEFNITVSILTMDASYANTTTSENKTITISDTIIPSVNFVSPTPPNNEVLDDDFIPVNISASDSGSGLKNITIYLYNSTRELVESQSGTSSSFFYNFTSLDDGIYYINATAYDNSNNSASTSTKTIEIDTGATSACTPSWTCDWSNCVNNTQTKINCVDANSCGTTAPTSNQTCVSCVTSWSCGNWTPVTCSSGSNQTKVCTDLSNCTAPTVERRTCVVSGASNANASGLFSLFSSSTLFFVILGIIILSIAGVFFALARMKKKSASLNSDNSGYTTYSPRGPPPPSFPPPGYANSPRVYSNQPQNY